MGSSSAVARTWSLTLGCGDDSSLHRGREACASTTEAVLFGGEKRSEFLDWRPTRDGHARPASPSVRSNARTWSGVPDETFVSTQAASYCTSCEWSQLSISTSLGSTPLLRHARDRADVRPESSDSRRQAAQPAAQSRVLDGGFDGELLVAGQQLAELAQRVELRLRIRVVLDKLRRQGTA